MRSTRLALAAALAATTVLTASPAHARHTCGLDDVNEIVNDVCESHGDPNIIRDIVCAILPTC